MIFFYIKYTIRIGNHQDQNICDSSFESSSKIHAPLYTKDEAVAYRYECGLDQMYMRFGHEMYIEITMGK